MKWEDKVDQETAKIMQEILERVRCEELVRGRWYVPQSAKEMVWCDASSIATGVVLEIDNVEVEDAAWLRKKDDLGHINVANLDAVFKGVNLALKWSLQENLIRTDFATVCGWMNSIVTADRETSSNEGSLRDYCEVAARNPAEVDGCM